MSELLYARKLYAFLQAAPWSQSIAQDLICLQPHLAALKTWWEDAQESCAIAQASDSLNLDKNKDEKAPPVSESVRIHHPVSGESRSVNNLTAEVTLEHWPDFEVGECKKAFWWFWRFCPELRTVADASGLLFPAHLSLPDCPQHSCQATVSALAGAMYEVPGDEAAGESADQQARTQPYLLLFSFSPVQEFIKASRKFLDFWAGSYLLHYLSAKLCWEISQEYGPDAVIVPSLWNQEVIDALLVKEYPDFGTAFKAINDKTLPVARFEQEDLLKRSLSLSTAGFPNVITALVPGRAAAEDLGKKLDKTLTKAWNDIGKAVREDITREVSLYCQEVSQEDKAFTRERKDVSVPNWKGLWEEFSKTIPDGSDPAPYKTDLDFWKPNHNNNQGKPLHPNWKWRKLWQHQLDYSWEPYWVAVPLGNPSAEDKPLPLSINKEKDSFDTTWITAQNVLSNSRHTIPSPAEKELYETLNVGSWWGSFQQRLGESLRAVKNTRVWQLPAAPGERSTLSGQFSVLHPGFEYGVTTRNLVQKDLREGAGLPEGSLRFFWFLMSKVYPGVFNGSERLNALELTKRMAWRVGGVAKDLGIKFSDIELTNTDNESVPSDEKLEIDEEEAKQLDIKSKFELQLDYERLIRFPNLSAIASARFVHDDQAGKHRKTQQYWKKLASEISSTFGDSKDTGNKTKRQRFAARTRGRPFQIPKTDQMFKTDHVKGQNYNGVMFSSKWLAEDMGLETPDEKAVLRAAVKSVHGDMGFGDRSPSDWWVIVLADGDNMGKYVSGTKLKPYEQYLNESGFKDDDWRALQKKHKSHETEKEGKSFLETRKRMGPASHVGLNRALLDFSNRLVPYLTEKRFCGRLVYSGGDDVMAVLPIEDLPGYLLSLRAAWCGAEKDPWAEQDDLVSFEGQGGYWQTQQDKDNRLPNRPLFTMGDGATMSMGIVIAHKSVPLPTVLESLWSAEKERAKKLPGKNGLCFRVIYGGGNQLEAVMNGDLLENWWKSIENFGVYKGDLAPVFYRLAEELPQRALLTSDRNLITKAAEVIMNRREHKAELAHNFEAVTTWLTAWETWAKETLTQRFGSEEKPKPGQPPWPTVYADALQGKEPEGGLPLGIRPDDLGQLLRFTAFWIDRRVERYQWLNDEKEVKL